MDSRDKLLHAIRIKGFASTAAAAETAALALADAEELLTAACAEGLVIKREGVISGWALTEAGREVHRRSLDAEMAAGSARETLGGHYVDFERSNAAFKQACTDWQLRDMTAVNLHDDPAYDAAVVKRLGAIHDDVVIVIGRMATEVPDLGRYIPRLADALSRVRAGDRDAFTKPLSGSYHDVWMELHEDLLVRLDRRRTEADA